MYKNVATFRRFGDITNSQHSSSISPNFGPLSLGAPSVPTEKHGSDGPDSGKVKRPKRVFNIAPLASFPARGMPERYDSPFSPSQNTPDGKTTPILPYPFRSVHAATPLPSCEFGVHPVGTPGIKTLLLSSAASAESSLKKVVPDHAIRIDCRSAASQSPSADKEILLSCPMVLFGDITQQSLAHLRRPYSGSDTVFSFLSQKLSDGVDPILAHCEQGMERSRAFLFIFLVNHLGINQPQDTRLGQLLFSFSTAGIGTSHHVLVPESPKFNDEEQAQFIHNGRLRFLLGLCALPGDAHYDFPVIRNDSTQTITFTNPEDYGKLNLSQIRL